MIQRNSPCWCTSGLKWKKCCYPKKPLESDEYYLKHWKIIIKTPDQIEKIRHACHVTKTILSSIVNSLKAGVVLKDVNQYCIDLHEKFGAIPASLNYRPSVQQSAYPAALCTSINDVVCHGIPEDQILKDGDIINIDVASIIDGFYGDCSCMVGIGNVSDDRKKLSRITYESMMKAIKICKPGTLLNEIGDVISDHAEGNGYTVVENYVGHGLGLNFHEAPSVQHNRNSDDIPLKAGMIFTIEPMINMGSKKTTTLDDMWTVITNDGLPSAQFEHTILITDDGYEILTPYENEIDTSLFII